VSATLRAPGPIRAPSLDRAARPDPAPCTAYPRLRPVFALAVFAQELHTAEHVAAAIQRLGFGESDPRGLLGAWFGLEWVHLAFNVTLAGMLVLLFVGYRMDRPQWRRASPVGWWAMVVALVVECGLHVPEHVVRVYQYLRYGWDPAPGILGHTAFHGSGPFDLFWLHTGYNVVVGVALVVAFVALPSVVASLDPPSPSVVPSPSDPPSPSVVASPAGGAEVGTA
jgi:hypothetical protein